MGATQESLEKAEHIEHAIGHNKQIALLIAVIALFLALSETLGKGTNLGDQRQCRGLKLMGLLPGQDHTHDRGAYGGRSVGDRGRYKR